MWIKEKRKAVLVAHSTLGGSGIAHLGRTSKQRRSLTRNMTIVNAAAHADALTGYTYPHISRLPVCCILDRDIEIYQISKCQERASSNAFQYVLCSPAHITPVGLLRCGMRCKISSFFRFVQTKDKNAKKYCLVRDLDKTEP